ncbi:transcription-repair coupling factor [Acidisoma cellulosilytica]|uniref:Transcription-repair-coupling factor n=1 Tax=Acidisoma cellulosilyticum TaxID=2802395 RepID=A0A963YZI0_9PROT|nr:transcription-repair coupling factor [Acidisoma cellulosilyticum]MCB8879744.1 transcription-repair coupling factor [Acidisoma cellulosilyticum]
MSRLTVYGAPEGWDAALLVRQALDAKGPILHVARDDQRLARMAEALAFFAPELPVLRFGAWDCLPYDRVSPNPAIVSERIAALAQLSGGGFQRGVVLTTVNGLIQRVPPRGMFQGTSLNLKPGATVEPEKLAIFLEAHGYARASTVMEPGEFAMRGGIIDLFPAGEPDPIRLDLFGDTIESMRRFDTDSQRSGDAVKGLTLHPVSEVPLDPESVARFRTSWRELFGQAATEDPLYLSISERRRHAGMEHWVPLFYDAMETLVDYMPGVSIALDHQAEEVLASRLELITDHYQARRVPPRDGETPYRPIPAERLYLNAKDWSGMLAQLPNFTFSTFGRPDGAQGVDGGGRPAPIFAPGGDVQPDVYDRLRAQAATWAGEKKRLVIAAWTDGSRERLGGLLREHGFDQLTVAANADAVRKLPPNAIALVTLGMERGFVGDRMAVVGEQDLLGRRLARPPRKRKRADQFIAEATDIAEGDLVVHEDHGIGRYDGLVTIRVNEAPHDCLRLIYDGDHKLFLPVENIEVLSRFGTETAGVTLDKLGGASWQNRKAKAKTRIRDMAAGLIRIAAERRLHEAPSLAPPEGMWDEFCAKFPFVETEDQSRAIADVLEDMASGRPMDRLICGDVGFGKTEVALRAAFVAAMSGSQVAVVVPTTLLARQHFRSFSARFAGLPINVAQLSRMVTAKEASQVKAGLADGTVNIVVGTHALLAKSISFADISLVIVDEEQHFGVAHKERLKSLKADVHVLTLTATPIPRTLQLALTGVREMSIIATPPVDRLAVRTFIMPFDGLVIREAIQRERFRGGQIFCVCPRLEDMERVGKRLLELVPDLRIVEAHGRLSPTDLERVMTEFGDGKYDVLLSTNIVESGLDMPAVNTLIIHRADMFGLGQLYQLRGRVGRGKQRGYAYLTWPPSFRLSAAAEKRLDVMQTLDTLGAGFTLASHDLDIRGAGNLLGDEQSGHIREVGIELYQQMLEDAVADLRAERGKKSRAAERDWTPTIGLGLPVLIPENYVKDLPVRLGLYRRIGALSSVEETEAMGAELVDRFGPLPEEVDNLLQVMTLKRICREAGVEKLDAGPKGMVLGFRGNAFGNVAGLIPWIGSRGGAIKLRPDHKLVVVADMDISKRIRLAKDILGNLARIAGQEKAA